MDNSRIPALLYWLRYIKLVNRKHHRHDGRVVFRVMKMTSKFGINLETQDVFDYVKKVADYMDLPESGILLACNDGQ